MSIKNVKDKAFASEALGKGIAILPEDDIISSPVSGEVVTLFPTSHAIGIKTEYGVEVLIHIGINTVELNGKYFESFIKQGDYVEIGQQLVRFDQKAIQEEGYDTTVMMVVTNSQDYLDVIATQDEHIDMQQSCLTVVI